MSWKVNDAGIFVLKVVAGNLQVIPYHSCSSKVKSYGILSRLICSVHGLLPCNVAV